jgi:GDP-D-mannose 3', 5'-epimerase
MKILICGAGGMIGTHLTNRLKKQGHYVVGVDIKYNEFHTSTADEFIIQDLSDQTATYHLVVDGQFDEIYNLAAVMGGMEYLANGENDYEVLMYSTLINWNVLEAAVDSGVPKLFFASSACAYNMTLQESPDVPALKESDAYPVLPDLEYGYQKLITERMYMAAERCHGIQVRIARFHNIYGPYTEWHGTKAKAPAALCRKVAEISHEVWIDEKAGTFGFNYVDVIGDGLQTRSFTWIDDCIDGIQKLMESDCSEPINIGSNEMIAINDLAKLIIGISGKNLSINNIPGPQGVRGRNSDNTMILEKLGWQPTTKLAEGIPKLYEWVNEQVAKQSI